MIDRARKGGEMDNVILVVKTRDGREVGRVPASALNASAYIEELTRFYGDVQIVQEQDKDAWLYAALV